MRAIRFLPLSLVFTAFFGLASPGQEGGSQSKPDNLYSVALFASIAEMDKSWSRFSRNDYHNMVVEKDPGITPELPSQVGEYRVEYLDVRGLIDRCKKARKEVPLLKIWPIQVSGAELKITINLDYLTYRKRRVFYAVSDWSEVTFRFDSQRQEFVLSGVKLGGI
jgi:hypothetical protein